MFSDALLIQQLRRTVSRKKRTPAHIQICSLIEFSPTIKDTGVTRGCLAFGGSGDGAFFDEYAVFCVVRAAWNAAHGR